MLEILKTGGFSGPEQVFIQPQQPVSDPGFSIISNLPWIVPAAIALLGLIWKIYTWNKSKNQKGEE